MTFERWARALAFPLLWIVSLAWGPRLQQLPTVCLWKRLTGFNCYGCGMGRALIAALRGEFATAFHLHRLVFVALVCLFVVSCTAAAEIRRLEA